MGVQAGDVVLRLLTRAAGDDRPALVVHLQHQLSRLGAAVAEQLLEDQRDVGHQVDRVVPDDHDPGTVVPDVLLPARLLDLDFGGRQGRHAAARTETPSSSKTKKSRPSTGTATLKTGTGPTAPSKVPAWG